MKAEARKSPKLVDWGQDFKLIVAPVNRILGLEARAEKYLHWWSFISAYYEIGECLFAQVIRIRRKRLRVSHWTSLTGNFIEKIGVWLT